MIVAKVSRLRPINVLKTICKYYERLIQRRLQAWSEEQGVLYAFQFGFRPNKS